MAQDYGIQLDHGVRGLLYVFSIPSLGHSLGTGSALAVKSRLHSTYLEHLTFHHPELNLVSAEDIIEGLSGKRG